jgi:hypothetical protein
MYSIASAVICIFLATSCATTYLNSGQFGQDSIVPLPQSRYADRSDSTMIFAGGSLATGMADDGKYSFAQGGLMRSWRRPSNTALFDGHFALSGWYGKANLQDQGDESDSLHALSVSRPFAFYGASAQIGGAIGHKFGTNKVMGTGLRCGIAYEDGAYRDFRDKASELPSHFEDCSPSGWSGNLGFDWAFTWSANKDRDFRTGVFITLFNSDLPSRFRDSDAAVRTMLVQPSWVFDTISFISPRPWNKTCSWIAA